MRMFISGLGNVGLTFLELIQSRAEELGGLQLVGVEDSSGILFDSKGLDTLKIIEGKILGKKLNDLEKAFPSVDFQKLYNEMDIYIDLLPTDFKNPEPSLSRFISLLELGKTVITANKGPLASNYQRIKGARDRGKGILKFGGTVAGALPTINTALYSLPGCKINGITGVLTGTTNFILNQMETGNSFEDALAQVKAKGITEGDGYLDTSGLDSAYKLVILVNSIMDYPLMVEDVNISGIMDLKELSEPTRLIASASFDEGGKVKAKVCPHTIDEYSPFYHIKGTSKGIVFETDLIGDLFVGGGKSGRLPAAYSVYRDLIQTIKNDIK
jgi:homoserine dehydrogenase